MNRPMRELLSKLKFHGGLTEQKETGEIYLFT